MYLKLTAAKFSKLFTKNPYQVLGIQGKITNEEIKKKYFELAKKYHPDVYEGNSDKFKEINEAYRQLLNRKVDDNEKYEEFKSNEYHFYQKKTHQQQDQQYTQEQQKREEQQYQAEQESKQQQEQSQ